MKTAMHFCFSDFWLVGSEPTLQRFVHREFGQSMQGKELTFFVAHRYVATFSKT